jgi:TRAP-type C4-dicarboxylate transport system permease small subunit
MSVLNLMTAKVRAAMPIFACVIVAILVSLSTAEPAWAYIGPGAGLSMLSAFWALLVAVFAALAFLILHPLRRYFRRRANANPPLHSTAKAGEFSESRSGGHHT